MSRLNWRILLILAAILLPLTIGTAGFILIERYSFLDALYMAVITVTTVGYFEIHPLSANARIFNVGLILFGVSMLLLAVGVMTQTIIELEFNRYFSRRRTKRMMEQLNNHFIVCGFGRVGRGAAEELRRIRRYRLLHHREIQARPLWRWRNQHRTHAFLPQRAVPSRGWTLLRS